MEDVFFMVDWKNKFIDVDVCIELFYVYISIYLGGNIFFRLSLFMKMKYIFILKNEKLNKVIFLLLLIVNIVFLV